MLLSFNNNNNYLLCRRELQVDVEEQREEGPLEWIVVHMLLELHPTSLRCNINLITQKAKRFLACVVIDTLRVKVIKYNQR